MNPDKYHIAWVKLTVNITKNCSKTVVGQVSVVLPQMEQICGI